MDNIEKNEDLENDNIENTPTEEMEPTVLDVDVQKLQENLENTTDRLKRLMAEFDNYKKRESKEKQNLYNSLVSDIMVAFLPVMDNLEKALNTDTKDEGYKQGMELVAKQFKDVLKSFGVEEIETKGKIFDPSLHEAVSSVQDDTKGSQEIVEEFRKGYKLGERVIRHAMVVVAN